MTPADAVLALTLAIAMYTDLTTGKIKNWLTFPVMAAGALTATLAGHAWWWGLAGMGAALVVSWPGYVFGRALHAGDVKLLMAAGTLIGPNAALYAVLFSYALGLPAGILGLAAKGKLQNLQKMVMRQPFEPTRMVYGVVVSLAIVIARLFFYVP